MVVILEEKMSPLRDFRCFNCGHVKEVFFHKESEIKHEKCPECDILAGWERMPPFVAPGKVKNGTPKFFKGK